MAANPPTKIDTIFVTFIVDAETTSPLPVSLENIELNQVLTDHSPTPSAPRVNKPDNSRIVAMVGKAIR